MIDSSERNQPSGRPKRENTLNLTFSNVIWSPDLWRRFGFLPNFFGLDIIL
jgi:hypothetical protein